MYGHFLLGYYVLASCHHYYLISLHASTFRGFPFELCIVSLLHYFILIIDYETIIPLMNSYEKRQVYSFDYYAASRLLPLTIFIDIIALFHCIWYLRWPLPDYAFLFIHMKKYTYIGCVRKGPASRKAYQGSLLLLGWHWRYLLPFDSFLFSSFQSFS